jgi:peptidoglycan biosynthesis protein MviN/MurJ (putative lipid II flippase)
MGAVSLSATLVVDGAMAATLGPSQVSIWNFGGKIFSFAAGTLALAIGTVFLPHVAHLAAEAEWLALRRRLWRTVPSIFGIGSVVALVLITVSPQLVRMVFAHGAFTNTSVPATVAVQRIVLLQLPFYLAATIPLRILFVLDRNPTVLIITMVMNVTNWLGDLLLKQIIGLPGIALSTTSNYVLSAAVTFVLAARAIRDYEGGSDQAVWQDGS